MDSGFPSVEYKLTKANNFGIRNWKDSDNKIKSVEYKLTNDNNLGLRNWKTKNKLNDTTVLPTSNTKEIAKTKATPPPVNGKQFAQKGDPLAATITKAAPKPQKSPQGQSKTFGTNGNNDRSTETSNYKTNISADTKIPTQSPKVVPATKEEEVNQPAKISEVFTKSYKSTPRRNLEVYIDPRTGERYPNYQRPLHAWQTPYQVRPRFEWQISEPMETHRFMAHNFLPPGYLPVMELPYNPMQRQMLMFPQYSYNMPRRIY